MQKLDSLYQKIQRRERLDCAEALYLYKEGDVHILGELANAIREEKHGSKSYFIINRHIDYSNVCVIKCKFCAFAKKKGDPDGFEFSIEQIVAKVTEALPLGITEIHMVGGFHPTHSFEFYLECLKAIKKAAPKVHIKAFTAAEIRYFARKFRKTQREVLDALILAGLDSMPGGGAEIFAQDVRREICRPKGPASDWLETHELVHQMGLLSNATMLYGHVESLADRVDHMDQIRKLQDKTGGFLSFIPLSFNPKDTEYESRGYTSGIDDLKTLALSRIFMDNFEHIKAYWVMSGVETAQLAQYYGADDLHGTVIEENITHMAGAKTPENLPSQKMVELIQSAGRKPVQRDSLYQTLHEFEEAEPFFVGLQNQVA